MKVIETDMKIVRSSVATSQMWSLDESKKTLIEGAIKRAAKDPYGQVALLGDFKGYYVVGVFPYKIVYKIVRDQHLIFVVCVLATESVVSLPYQV